MKFVARLLFKCKVLTEMLVLQATEVAQNCIRNVLNVLNKVLATRTFLVGERVTLADISCVCNMLLLYKQVSLEDNNAIATSELFFLCVVCVCVRYWSRPLESHM